MAVSRFQNRQKVVNRLKRLPDAMKTKIRAAMAKGADEIVSMQRRLVAVDSGDLRKTIQWNWGARKIRYSQGSSKSPAFGLTISAGGQVAGVDVRYAHIVEFGAAPHVIGGIFKGQGVMHPGIDAQPFFYPSYRAKKKSFRNRYRRAMRQAIVQSR